MIVVEGPDNSGKSTLVEQLTKKFNLIQLVHYKKGPPQNVEDNFRNSKYIIDKVISLHSKRLIVDRLSLIGESIYGPICRGKDLWVSDFERKQKLINSLNVLDPFFIYCRPPSSVVLDLRSHQEKDYDTEDHLQKIKDNRSLILNSYDNYFYRWHNYNFFRYDYTKSSDFYELCLKLKEYLK